MSRTLNAVVPVALLFSALALSACATKEAPPIAPPAPVEVVAETPPAPEAVPAPAPVAVPAPAPVVIAEQPSPKPVVVHKAKQKAAKKPAPKAAPPAPVAAPAPVVEQKAPAVVPPPEPSPPAPVAPPPAKKVAEPGFLEKYWLLLLGLGIVIAGVVVWRKKAQG
jgi:hypothetical protein